MAATRQGGERVAQEGNDIVITSRAGGVTFAVIFGRGTIIGAVIFGVYYGARVDLI